MAELVAVSAELSDESVYLMIETINLRCIADDAVESVKIVVELLLQVGCTFYLFLDPYMACRNKLHHLFLLLQLFLGLVGILEYHTCQDRVIALGTEKTPILPIKGKDERKEK